jgi:hypothetical protein
MRKRILFNQTIGFLAAAGEKLIGAPLCQRLAVEENVP